MMLGKIEGRRRRGRQRMRRCGHEFGQTPGDGEGQGGLVCCSPWGHKELDTTEQLNSNKPPTAPKLAASEKRCARQLSSPL